MQDFWNSIDFKTQKSNNTYLTSYQYFTSYVEGLSPQHGPTCESDFGTYRYPYLNWLAQCCTRGSILMQDLKFPVCSPRVHCLHQLILSETCFYFDNSYICFRGGLCSQAALTDVNQIVLDNSVSFPRFIHWAWVYFQSSNTAFVNKREGNKGKEEHCHNM